MSLPRCDIDLSTLLLSLEPIGPMPPRGQAAPPCTLPPHGPFCRLFNKHLNEQPQRNAEGNRGIGNIEGRPVVRPVNPHVYEVNHVAVEQPVIHVANSPRKDED